MKKLKNLLKTTMKVCGTFVLFILLILIIDTFERIHSKPINSNYIEYNYTKVEYGTESIIEQLERGIISPIYYTEIDNTSIPKIIIK
jgi:hypothetical protein